MRTLTYNSKGKIENGMSVYQPSTAVRELTQDCFADIQKGDENITRPYDEFNGVSLVDRMNEDQKNWLGWMPDGSDDPEDDWRWFGIRPITRNKIISTAAHLTQNLIAPAIFAQNDSDEEDRIAGWIMSDLLEYNIRRSHYEQAFLYGVISGLVNPVSYFEVSYKKSYQMIWEDDEQKRVLDDELSGFQYDLTRPEEILFANPYQFFLQKQGFVARSRRVQKSELEGTYGEHENWKYVNEGQIAFCGDDGIFYDIEDENDDMVNEIVYMRRQDDMQIPFVNGIYLGNTNTEYNPFYHRTNKNKPKYPWVKYGAEPIDNMRFFGYKSLAAKMANDQELVDRQWQMSMDSSFLATFAPTITIGAGKIDKAIMTPAQVTNLNEGAQVVPLTNNFRPDIAFSALREAERSINESSIEPQLQGSTQDLPGTLGQSQLVQANAEKNLGVVGRMIGVMVKELGELMIDDIIRYQTVGEMDEIVGDVPKMKYHTFILENKQSEGKTKSHIIKFTDKNAGKTMTEDEYNIENLKRKDKAGEEKELSEINPELFAKLNFLVSVDYQQMFLRNTPVERSFKLAVYDKAIQNPIIAGNPESLNAITRDFLLEPIMKGDASKYLPDTTQNLIPPAPQGAKTSEEKVPSRIMQSAAMEEVGRL